MRPIEGFRLPFDHVQGPFTEAIRDEIREHTRPSNPREAPEGQVHQLKRNSRANVWNSKPRLTDEEIARVRDQVEDMSAR